MDCSKIEHWLSEYIESSLPVEEMDLVTNHLKTCSSCSALEAEMRSLLSLCHSYPALEMDPDFVSDSPPHIRRRTRSFRERFQQYFVRPLLTPRFAVGRVLQPCFWL
jgi:predicted anti-sigma-YlaC factor YlaD